MKEITLIVPCYNEEASINLLYKELYDVAHDLNGNYLFEFLFINDGSSDKTLEKIKKLRVSDDRVKYIDFSRNFGKEAAILAGLDNADGDCVIIMDADLQHPPSLIPELIETWENGFNDVYAKRDDRHSDGFIRRHLSPLFYKLLQKISEIDILPNVGDFRLLDKKCVNALRQLRESERYTKGLYCWIGFAKKEISYNPPVRLTGESKWSMGNLIGLAINGITSFSVLPLRISAIIGFIVSVIAIFYLIYVFIKTLAFGDSVAGFPTLIIVILFLGGFQLISLGIIGEYLGRIFNETKNRPVYVIRESEI